MATHITHTKREPNGDVPIGACDRCGKFFPLTQLFREWSGLTVCKSPEFQCFEAKHESLDFQVRPDHSLAHAEPKLPRDEGSPDADIESQLRSAPPWGQ